MRRLAIFISVILLTYLYLFPGSQALLDHRHDIVMSDDSDPASLPYSYDLILKTFAQAPSRFLFGSIYVDQGGDPQDGLASWMPWNERWLVLVLSSVVPIEQLSTALVFVLMAVNFFALFGYLRAMKWPSWLAFGLALAWAFNPYTRARGKVHMALAGIYHIPLLLWALHLISTKRSKGSLGLAAGLLLLCGTVNHYYIVTTAFLAPFWLLFPLLNQARSEWKTVMSRLAVAALPLTFFLAFNFAFPVPPDQKLQAQQALPRSGEFQGSDVHPFLNIFAARPIDYLGGDISLSNDPSDLNPLKTMINESILQDLGTYGNSHERTNGIRWIIVLLAVLAVVIAVKDPKKIKYDDRSLIFFFVALGLFTFSLSLPPAWFGNWASPAWWLQSVVSQVRVPSRAGIFVHFSALMLAGLILRSWKNINWKVFGPLFAFLILLDSPPLYQKMPMAAIRPQISSLQLDSKACGPGMYFPFLTHYQGNAYYYFLQRMRGSGCPIINMMEDNAQLSMMIGKFPVDLRFLASLPTNQSVGFEIERLVRCLPLNWIVFDPATPSPWREDMCKKLGWNMTAELSCISPKPDLPLQRLPTDCR